MLLLQFTIYKNQLFEKMKNLIRLATMQGEQESGPTTSVQLAKRSQFSSLKFFKKNNMVFSVWDMKS